MTRAWLRKELREHGWAFIAWAVMGAATFGLLLFILITREARSSWFEATRNFTAAWSVVGVIWLAGRLIRREYASRTQLFLESLPVTRGRILTVKWVLGAALSVLSVLLAIAVTAWVSRQTQVLTSELLGSITVRLVSTILFAWALAAMAGVLGRYRVPLMLFLLIALGALAELTALELTQEGPLRLLGDDLPYESRLLPLRALITTWVATALFTATTFVFVLARDGALTVQLSDRMTHREKVYVTCVLLAFSAGISTFAEAREQAPFRLEDPLVAEVGKARVELAWEPDLSEARARSLADHLAAALESTRVWLKMERLVSLALVPTRELDPDEVQSAYVSHASGSVARAHLAHPELDVALLTSLALHDVVSETLDDGAMRERLHWVLDGVSHLRGEESVHGEAGRRLLWLRAAYNDEYPPLAAFLAEWEIGDERRGSCVQTALAATVLMTLEAVAGAEAMQRLARRALVTEAAQSRLRKGPPPEALIREETGLTLEALEQQWHQALRDFRRREADALQRIPRATGTASLVRVSGKTFELRHAVTLSPAPPTPVRYSVRYGDLGPFDVGVLDEELELHQALATGEPSTLPPPLIEGDRWLWTVNVPIAELRCSVRVLSERREIR